MTESHLSLEGQLLLQVLDFSFVPENVCLELLMSLKYVDKETLNTTTVMFQSTLVALGGKKCKKNEVLVTV